MPKAGGDFIFFFQLRRKFKSKHFPRLLLTAGGMVSVCFAYFFTITLP